jgi:hypothetical protein
MYWDVVEVEPDHLVVRFKDGLRDLTGALVSCS